MAHSAVAHIAHRGTVDASIEAGQAAERAGKPAQARAHFEAALAALGDCRVSATAASLLRWIGRTYADEGDHESATECVEESLAVARACGDRAAEGHATNVLAFIEWSQGNLDVAELLYLKARECALAAGDLALVGMTSNNLGTIANIRGDLAEALHQYSTCLEHYRALVRPKDVCEALNNMGRLFTDLQRWSDAEAAYAEGVAISRELDDRRVQIGIHVNFAEMWLARKDPASADATIRVAEELAAGSGDTVWLAEIAKLRGTICRERGMPRDAERHLSDAVQLAEARQDQLLLAEALRERAELYRGEGRNREALQNLNRAHRLFTQMRAKLHLANVDRAVSRLENDFVTVVERWGESIEAKDRYTQGHCVRVANLACAIAEAWGIQGQELFWFRIGALLHDVGKLIVPAEVLNKAGPLTDEEWALMRNHTTAGVDMLAGIDFPWDVRPIIESHHERWDGRGYPHRLAGEQIPLSARILAVADVYDALTSVRSYKSALSHETAFEIMRQDSGAAFDPAVFAVFERVMREGCSSERFESRPWASPVSDAADLGRAPASRELAALPTREAMRRITERAMADRRASNAPLSLLVLTVSSDEPAGPRGGDCAEQLLEKVCHELRRATRNTDFVARTGEWEFTALLTRTCIDQAASIAQRLTAALGPQLCSDEGEGRRPVVELRVAGACGPDDTVAALFARAGLSFDC